MTKSKISAVQVVILLFLSRTFNVLNYVPAFHPKIQGTSMLYGTIIAFFISAIIVTPPLILYKRFNGENIVDLAYKKSKLFGIILSFCLFVIPLMTLIGTVVGFQYFIVDAVYADASIELMVITICVACFLGALHKLEGISRASTIIFAFFMIGTLFIFFVSIPSVEMINIRPTLEEPIVSSFSYAFNLISMNPELYVFILLLPRINGNVNKSAFWFLVLTFLFVGITNFLIMGVFGDFFATQTFPYYALASVIEFSILQRLDSIHMTIWVFVSFIRITLFIIVTNTYLQNIIPKSAKKLGIVVTFLITVICSIVISHRTSALKTINSSVPIIVITLVFVIPTILLLTTKKKEKKCNESKDDFVIAANGS